jgi:uncharacterized membrane protein (DUF485 family)
MALFQPREGAGRSTAAPRADRADASGAPRAAGHGDGAGGQSAAGLGTAVGHGDAAGRRSAGGLGTAGGRVSASGYEVVRASRDFWTIRRRFGSFVGPACVLFIGWYFLFVLLSVFAPGFMGISVFGNLKLGLCIGLLQFVSTFAIAAAYRRWARRRLDPLADRLRHRLEGAREQ